ncbi:sensor histidine kinase [Flaviaesturariibacter aridisoli]|uniref:histidine kinase n=1 Tax=Flaviaesturariibacter aridisoli TaxID=2545761 RepID=A0A4R4E0S3_9BACT|nr:response regulator [Flaviaesturariibacter aridisoli]TCZ71437.1 hybrid sensor histidine kinase/response regulator [Flaviaesturariibacter aridisoli]
MVEVTKDAQLDKSDVKILVVDDREDNLLSIETILERDGYHIRKANSGRQALKILLAEHDFTLILMDVQMPDMNGFETASLIYEREKLRNIPIIFITAHNKDEEYMFKGYKMGAVDFIYKPINPELMRFKVSVFADLYRKTHELMQQERNLLAAKANLEREIEERKINEEKIRLLNAQLTQNNSDLKTINEELDRFAYVASHDLQEPLRKIMVFSDVVATKLSGKVEPDVQNSLNKIVKASDRMQKLINDLLKFSRHASSSEDFARVDLGEVLQEVISDLEQDIQQKSAQVEFSGMPVLQAIPSQVRQLFQNLLGNALKFSRDGVPPKVEIFSESVVYENAEGRHLRQHRIVVKDNGIGFDAKYADDIFVVFKRLHSYHEFEGSGIGLSICKKIVDQHKGSIRATGTLNQGATFVVTLPETQDYNALVLPDTASSMAPAAGTHS